MKRTIIIPVVTFTLVLTSCGSGSDDGTAGNCFLGLLLLLCWLKGGK